MDYIDQVWRLAEALSFSLKIIPQNVGGDEDYIFKDVLLTLSLLIEHCQSKSIKNILQSPKNKNQDTSNSSTQSENTDNFKNRIENVLTPDYKIEHTVTIKKEIQKSTSKDLLIKPKYFWDENIREIKRYKEDMRVTNSNLFDQTRVCEIDNLTFPDTSKYTSHMRTHKFSKCPKCDKKLKANSYTGHLKKCTKERIISCDDCSYFTYREDILKRHKKMHRVRCNLCDKSFRKVSQRQMHIEKFHSQSQPVESEKQTNNVIIF